MNFDAAGIFGTLCEQIAFAANHRIQGHYQGFTQGINGRIGDLRKLLAEIIGNVAFLPGKYRHGGVVAHGAHRFLSAFGENADDLIFFLKTDAKGLFAEQQVGNGQGRGQIMVIAMQMLRKFIQPFPIRMTVHDFGIDAFRVEEASARHIYRDQLAGSDPPLHGNVLMLVVENAYFRSNVDDAVFGDDITRGPQTIAIQSAGGDAAGVQNQTGGAIPGFHAHGVIFIKSPQSRFHMRNIVPGRGHQQADGLEEIHAALHQQLQHVVETEGITATAYGRKYLSHGQQVTVQLRFPGLSPESITLHRIQFAIMGENAERLAKAPLRPGVGGKSLMIGDQCRAEARVAQVGIKYWKIFRKDQALIADYLRRTGDGKKLRVCDETLFYPATQAIQQPLMRIHVLIFGQADKYLPDGGQAAQGFFSACRVVGRYLPPGNTAQAEIPGFCI